MSNLSTRRPALGALAAVLALLGTACAGGPTAPVDTDTFVEAVVALRMEAALAESPDHFERRRTEVLRELGVSQDELRAYVEAWTADPAHMSRVWSSVRQILRERAEQEPELEFEGDRVAPDRELLDPDADADRLDVDHPDAGKRGARPLPEPPPGRIR